MKKRFTLKQIAAALYLILTGCSGGGLSSLAPGAVVPHIDPTPTPSARPTATPTIAPTIAPTATASPTPTPSPTPTLTPTPIPPGPLTLNPTTVWLNQTASGLPAPSSATVAISDPNYSGTFSETDNCAGIATIAITGPTITSSGLLGGTCTVTVRDSFGDSARLTIINTTTIIEPSIVQGARP